MCARPPATCVYFGDGSTECIFLATRQDERIFGRLGPEERTFPTAERGMATRGAWGDGDACRQ